jgi:hemoglobin-like flavoprotein
VELISVNASWSAICLLFGILPREADITPAQRTLVQASFAKVLPIADTAATLFYEDLFRRNPSLRALFKEDMADQRQKLMTMIGTAVANLGDWGNIAPAIAALGRRHAAYGVKTEDYDTVGKALIATLQKGLGDAFTPEAKEAWLACYAAVAAEMIAGAQAPQQ